MNATSKNLNPFALALSLVGVATILIAGALSLWALSAADDYPANPALIAGLNAWTDLLIIVGLVSFIGATILGGVRWLVASSR